MNFHLAIHHQGSNIIYDANPQKGLPKGRSFCYNSRDMKKIRYSDVKGLFDPLAREDISMFDALKSESNKLGNRVFSSKNKGFFDNTFRGVRPEKTERAAILISPEGQRFLKQRPHFLSEIDKALLEIESKKVTHVETPYGILQRLENVRGEVQSTVYHIMYAAEHVKIRVAKTKGPEIDDATQALNKEMIQIQMVKRDLQEQFQKLGIEFPLYYFATSIIAGIRFEEGAHPNKNDQGVMRRIEKLEDLLDVYSRTQREAGNKLWYGVTTDTMTWTFKGFLHRFDNFIKRPDGTLVCIDPFYKGRRRI